MEHIYELYNDLPRQGPGDNASTKRALSLIPVLPEKPLILDIGCGSGMQTIELARATNGTVTGVDNYQPFLDVLLANAKHNVKTVNASMDQLPFDKGTFDLIWSEGAIYLMGFENGLNYWRDFLSPGGYMAVTEITWLNDNPHHEPKSFWQAAYPEMKTVAENLKTIKSSEYRNIGNFVLPESSWWEDYYFPLLSRIEWFRKKYSGNNAVLAIADEVAAEIDLYRRYSDNYGYVFYVMQKSD
ncbi:class I SAM-dependent methyltransferase [Dethiobacter alkaliphilus]|uniref:Methyltransferase type 11 n=1 Tax=Dethiobacter alkaliphilus AHT 1 TaxID=555088 RepID=C0GD18_DETAL|nr:class I SAM-dependent methyltransferase [Dethiobacter alkaliphilus]EEG79103.1 Methyltransferase type 11 [Dethiobacter alkaliphilus AHT 1]